MRCLLIRNRVPARPPIRVIGSPCRFIARLLPPIFSCAAYAVSAFSQDSGREEKQSYGNGATISVTVRDSSGEPIASPAMVKLYRDGTIPSSQAQTSHGTAILVVNSLGEFNVVVSAAGYGDAQKSVSVQVAGRAQVDVYLRSNASSPAAPLPAGRPVLAPKAKQAVDKGLEFLSAGNPGEAAKYVQQAMRLAPSHPDVLYVQGVLSLKQRNWTQAQSALEKATQMDPNHARAFAALGMALCDQGKYDLAIAPLEKSLQLDSGGSWETRWALSQAYYRQQQYDHALKMSQDALAASNGKAPELMLLVAQSLTAVARYDDGAQLLRQFLNDHPDHAEAATARRWLKRLTASGKIRVN